jgi:phospholipid/cholesterol/gamma-HCH transport system ATP-binding protein
MSFAIRARGVSKSFGSKVVLRGVDIDAPQGRSTVLIGPSSSGKSVLLKCLLGLLPMDRGQVHYNETDLASLDKSALERFMRDVGVLFQQNALFDSLTVWENVAFTLIHGQGMGRRTAKEIALETLASVGLQPTVADLSPAELSGGMQKRAALARAVAAKPELLVLDDPTAGLDPIMTNTIVALIRDAIDQTGATALTVTSNMSVAKNGFDRVAMLHEGEIVWQGDTADVENSGNAYLEQLINQRAQGPIQMRLTD